MSQIYVSIMSSKEIAKEGKETAKKLTKSKNRKTLQDKLLFYCAELLRQACPNKKISLSAVRLLASIASSLINDMRTASMQHSAYLGSRRLLHNKCEHVVLNVLPRKYVEQCRASGLAAMEKERHLRETRKKQKEEERLALTDEQREERRVTMKNRLQGIKA